MKAKTLRILVFAAALPALAACGGGGGGTPVDMAAPPAEPGADLLAEARSDPRVARLGEILGRSDALLFSSLHSRYSASGGGAVQRNTLVERMDCAGARCVAEDGTAFTAADLTEPVAGLDVSLDEAALGARGGFDTVATRGRFEITESVAGVTVTAEPTAHSYGFWGAHGYAALELGSGPLSGETDGTAFTGVFAFARAYAAGDASGTNPAGVGSATWRGVAEASSTGAFERLQGTATVSIADLSRPRVGVSVFIPGHSVGAPGWADMPLTRGRFAAGTAGTDYLAGHFHGPAHEEAWGVFDTTGYIGAFGAKRAP